MGVVLCVCYLPFENPGYELDVSAKYVCPKPHKEANDCPSPRNLSQSVST